jgi:pimeloyl-ACP methyl ester carboxylesterase
VLVDSLDPSITDEAHPDDRDVTLDLYDPNGPQPPYDTAFVERFRAAQRARNRRITASVEEQLAALRATGRPHDERGFVVRGTMADPRWLDPAIDPNQRTQGVSFLGDPRVVNDGPVGLARFCTLRSWLSQWSIDHAHGDGIAAARDVGVPTLVVCNGADEICTPGYAHELFDAVGHDDKTFVEIDGANHYYLGRDQIEKVRASTAICVEWLAERGLS